MNIRSGKRGCEWKGCPNEGCYHIQTSSLKDDIHWFCKNHARTFDLSVVSQGPFIGVGGPNWTQKPQRPKGHPDYNHHLSISKINPNIRMNHMTEGQMLNYIKKIWIILNYWVLQQVQNRKILKKRIKHLSNIAIQIKIPNLRTENIYLIKSPWPITP